MTRLQKKCLVAAAGTHLLVVIVVVCSGFVRPRLKMDATPLLDVIPSTAIDALLRSGARDAQTPPRESTPPPTPPTPPTPVVQVQPPPPPEPKPEVTPVIKPTEVTRPEPIEPDDRTAELPKPAPKKKHDPVKVDLTKVVTRPVTKVPDTSAADAEAEAEAKREAREQKRILDQKLKAFRTALTSLNNGLSTSTEVKLPGSSTESYANYGSIVASVYHEKWIAPTHMSRDSAVVTFAVTITRDGSVRSSHIESGSGDPSIDNAVQRLLDRVTFIHEFPADSTEQERTYHIDFNANRTNQ